VAENASTLLDLLAGSELGRLSQKFLQGPPSSGQIGGVTHPGAALVAALWLRLRGRTVCLIVDSPEEAFSEARTWLGSGDEEVCLFPAPDVLPFDRVAPAAAVLRYRLGTLRRVRTGPPPLVVTSPQALARPTLAPDWVGSWLADLEVGSRIAPTDFARLLLEAGYRNEPVALTPGDFSRRGGIVDCFPLDSRPWRAEWDGDVVAGLWRLDPETQGSRARLNRVSLMPAREFPMDSAALARAAERLRATDLAGLRDDVRQRWEAELARLEDGAQPESLDTLAPLLAEPGNSLLAHLPHDAVFISDRWPRLRRSLEAWVEEVAAIKEAETARGELPVDLPLALVPLGDVENRLGSSHWVDLSRQPVEGPALLRDLGMGSVPAFNGDLATFAGWAKEFTGGGGALLQIGLQEERVVELATELRLDPILVPEYRMDVTPILPGRLTVAPGDLERGLVVGEVGVISDSDLFGAQKRRPSNLVRTVHRAESSHQGRLHQSGPVAPESGLLGFELQLGDVVVHRDHGVGRFLGMRLVSSDEGEREYMQLEYADGHRLYVPAEHLDRIQRYVGGVGANPQLSRLGTGEWERTRRGVRRRIDQIAEELVELYSRRQKAKGHAFAPDSRWQQELEASFPYQETRDQTLVLEDIKRDMEAERPMDRLLCGDVGFGKTEIALRAAFKAVEDGWQVAVLVPTTVLAQQHYLTFKERLRAFPVVVEQLSRLRSDEEAAGVLSGLAAGTVDIVIGTHRLLQRDVRFKRLGLAILDEEQRFGVLQKERLKQLRTAVDVLSLSATPIPRTLHMALAGIRDLSVIRTPPEGRLPIRTYVTAKEEGLVQDVIRRELARRGQVYYVHNRVQTMVREVELVRRLVPEARVAVAHGQMEEGTLARAMVAFASGEVDVLCCTTIIENGLDIPNANTLIVDDASRLGLAQLYQLRGRVGRSGQRAYAYFLYDPERSLTEQADKRLDVVSELQDLGAGLTLAIKDLEIRGAGNVLGEAQHGDVAAVGIEMYNHLLRQAVLEAQGEEMPESPAQVTVSLPLRSLLPHRYIADERLRLRIYQQLAAATEPATLDELARNLRQRFGPRPPEVENLLVGLRVRLAAAAAGAAAVESGAGEVVVRFDPGHGLDLGRMAQEMPAVTASGNQLRLRLQAAGPEWPQLLLLVLRRLADQRVLQPVGGGR
jgi:transcription-repair coupling factor (superfamily II helicase)